jgi:FG-GAP-like repeat/FG-GAP repeat
LVLGKMQVNSSFFAQALAVLGAACLCGLAGAGAAAADQFVTAAGSPAPIGSAPVALATGDVNNDGFTDVIAANSSAATVSAVLGNGAGQLSAPVPSAVGNGPDALGAADFNADGALDLAVADAGDSDVRIMVGNAGGFFSLAPGSPIVVGALPVAIATADFTGTGTQDLAVASAQGNSVSVLLGNGQAAFASANGSPMSVTDPVALATADFNRDGIPDLAVLDQVDHEVFVFLGTGTGSFVPAPGSPVPVGTGPIALASADFNTDGNPDLAVANRADGTVTVLLGQGDGSFAGAPGSPLNIGGALSALAVADFNGDGIPDLALADSQINSVTGLLGTGDGGFTGAPGSPFPVGAGPDALAVGDFNGDGHPDLAVANGTDGTVSVLIDSSFRTDLCFSCEPPVLGQSVDVAATRGQVRVSLPGRNGKGLPFVPLHGLRRLPVGTLVDTSGGTVRLASAVRQGRIQTADLSGAVFQALQNRQQRGLTSLQVVAAPRSVACRASGRSVSLRRLSGRVLALLHATAKGSFRTVGRYSAATVRGTAWDTVERCDGTLTRVHRGVVIVRDFRLRRNVTVRAGKSYLARVK